MRRTTTQRYPRWTNQIRVRSQFITSLGKTSLKVRLSLFILVDTHKVEEIEKILIKKLLIEQPMHSPKASQSNSKKKFNKKKLSPANENLQSMLQEGEGGKGRRRAEYKKERMMTSVKQLLERTP